MIRVVGATKTYNGKRAVDNVTVDIPKGQITSLIGPNGAGKSTLLSMISRLTPMDGGDVFIEGLPLREWDNRDLAKEISILKQTNNVDLRLTVRDLVAFGRFPYSQGRLTPEDVQHVDEAIEYMNLGPIQHRFLDELSGGERQRAFVAMVIAQNTNYVLLDEPLNNLDMKHSVQMMHGLRRLVDELGKTVVLVLHDINFASTGSDRIVAMRDGRLVADGPVADVVERTVLQQVYDMDFHVQEIDRCRVCLYFMPDVAAGAVSSVSGATASFTNNAMAKAAAPATAAETKYKLGIVHESDK